MKKIKPYLANQDTFGPRLSGNAWLTRKNTWANVVTLTENIAKGGIELTVEKSRIRETNNISPDVDSSTDHKVIHNFHPLYPYLRVIIFF